MTGEQARRRLRAMVDSGGVLIGAGAGTGLSAKCAEAGGADLISIYNSGRYRMAGRGSLAGLLPYGDANAIVMEMAGEVLPVVDHTPVLAGVCGTDPFRLMSNFLRDIEAAGFVEVQMINMAADKGLVTAPYVFDVPSAEAMTRARPELPALPMGPPTPGSIR